MMDLGDFFWYDKQRQGNGMAQGDMSMNGVSIRVHKYRPKVWQMVINIGVDVLDALAWAHGDHVHIGVLNNGCQRGRAIALRLSENDSGYRISGNRYSPTGRVKVVLFDGLPVTPQTTVRLPKPTIVDGVLVIELNDGRPDVLCLDFTGPADTLRDLDELLGGGK